MMTSQKICFIIITLGSRQEQEIMWAEDVLKKWHFFTTFETNFAKSAVLERSVWAGRCRFSFNN